MKKTIGPMMAHTTSTSLRLWYRSAGEITCRLKQNLKIISTLTKTSDAQFDYILLFEFSNLEANTLYQYEILKEARTVATGEARTFDNNPHSKCSFITGSCRHHPTLSSQILRWLSFRFGSSDDSFKTISNLIDRKILDPDFFIMSGDQVYADHSHWSVIPFGPAKTFEDFQWHYHKAYTTPFFSKLASRYPFFMAMDDHEIRNDWKMDMALKAKNQIPFANGLKAYTTYQAALSGVIENSENLNIELKQLNDVHPHRKEEDRKLYYHFDQGPASVFVMDCRLERYPSSQIPQMLAPTQMGKLKEWLIDANNQEQVKFIVSSVPFFPDAQDIPLLPGAPEDKWAGFPEQRFEILEYIRRNRIRKVVFISGDVHVSLAAELLHQSETDFKVYSIICSGFFWPMKGLSLQNFNWENLVEKHLREGEKTLPDLHSRGEYQVRMLSKWSQDIQAEHQKHNFCSIETDGKCLHVSYFLGSSGERFEQLELSL